MKKITKNKIELFDQFKTRLNESTEYFDENIEGHDVIVAISWTGAYASMEIPSENPTFEDDFAIKVRGNTKEEALSLLKSEYAKYKKNPRQYKKDYDKNPNAS